MSPSPKKKDRSFVLLEAPYAPKMCFRWYFFKEIEWEVCEIII